MSLFPVFAPVAAAPATIAFGASANSGTNATSYTFSSLAIGSVTANRKVVIAIGTAGASGAMTITGCSVGGESCTQGITATNTSNGAGRCDLWYIDDPDSSLGTTEDVIVTTSATARICFVASYDMKGAASGGPSDTDTDVSAGGTHTFELTVPAGGVAICHSFQNIGTSTTYTWTNLTEDYDDTGETNLNHSGASLAFAAATSLTVTSDPIEPFDANCCSSGAAWGT